MPLFMDPHNGVKGLNMKEAEDAHLMDLKDFFSAAVQLAKRICDFAEQNTVMVSGIIKDLCLG